MNSLRIGLGVLLTLHGIAHFPGFVVSWRLATLEDLPYKTTVLNGAMDVGDTGIRVLGLLFLLAGLAVTGAGICLAARVSWALPAALAATGFSLVVCAVSLPVARIGLTLNAAAILLLLASRALGWLH